jgi:hypothetical protein
MQAKSRMVKKFITWSRAPARARYLSLDFKMVLNCLIRLLALKYSPSNFCGHAVTLRSKYSAMGCNQLQTVPPASADCL